MCFKLFEALIHILYLSWVFCVPKFSCILVSRGIFVHKYPSLRIIQHHDINCNRKIAKHSIFITKNITFHFHNQKKCIKISQNEKIIRFTIERNIKLIPINKVQNSKAETNCNKPVESIDLHPHHFSMLEEKV